MGGVLFHCATSLRDYTTCVKWGSSYSNFLKLQCGVRQGGVLSPFLFAVFVDSLVDRVKLLDLTVT